MLTIPRSFCSFRGLGSGAGDCPLTKGIRALKSGATVFLISRFARKRPFLDESAGNVYLPEHLLSRLDRTAIDGLAALQLAANPPPFWMLFLQLEVPLLLWAWPRLELAGSPTSLLRAIHGSCLVQGRSLTVIGWLPRLVGNEAPIDRLAALASAGGLAATRADLYRILPASPDPDRYPLPDLTPNSSGT